jgi:hypothetical protein
MLPSNNDVMASFNGNDSLQRFERFGKPVLLIFLVILGIWTMN